jgi:hypothetical protein
MDMELNFSDMAMDFDSLDVLPGYNLHKKSSVERLARLRQLLVERGLDGYLIVDSDAHYTFYAQARKDRRINYITNSEVCFHNWVSEVNIGAMWSCDCGEGEGRF